MGFDNVPDPEPITLKISFGEEIRRLTVIGPSYAPLCEKVAGLFGWDLNQNRIVVKYQDDDEDKVTLASDAEFQEAVRLYKKMEKVLRLIVSLEALPPLNASTNASTVVAATSASAPPLPLPQADPLDPLSAALQQSYLGPSGTRAASASPSFASSYSSSNNNNNNDSTNSSVASISSTQSLLFAPGSTSASSISLTASQGRGEDRHCHRHHHNFHHHHPHHPHHKSRFGGGGGGGSSCNASSLSVSLPGQPAQQPASVSPLPNFSYKDLKLAYIENKRVYKAAKRQANGIWSEDLIKWKASLKLQKAEFKAIKEAAQSWRGDRKPRYVARHVEDVTIPDGTELPPNTPFIKTWKIRNDGPVWPTGSQLVFVSKGYNLRGPERVVIKGDVQPGQEVEVSVPLITPQEPGRYVGYYRMVTPDGKKFGQRVWVSIIVAG